MGNIVLRPLVGLEHQVRLAPSQTQDFKLPLTLGSCGFEYRSIPEEYSWHGLQRGDHATVLLQYTVSGSGSLRYEDQHFDVQPGQLMLLTFPHDHHYFLAEGHHWEHIYMIAHGPESLRLAQAIIQQHGPIIPLLPHGTCMTRFAQLIRVCIDGQLEHALQASERLYAIFMSLLAPTEHLQLHPDHLALQQALAFGQAHLASDIGVADLAQAANMSRFHFSRHFKQTIGISPGNWINRQRIERAAQLLSTHQFSLEDIASQCGFNDVNYFGKVFKRIRGVSPGQFRDSGLFI